MLAAAIDNLAQIDGPAIAQLPGPITELVSAIAHREWIHIGEEAIAAKYFRKVIFVFRRNLQIQKLGHFPGVSYQLGPGHRCGFHP